MEMVTSHVLAERRNSNTITQYLSESDVIHGMIPPKPVITPLDTSGRAAHVEVLETFCCNDYGTDLGACQGAQLVKSSHRNIFGIECSSVRV